MKIACIGSNLESEKCLHLFESEGINIDLLITRPENNAGNVSDYVNLHPFCKKHNIPTLSTVNVNSEDTVNILKEMGIDVLLTLGWSQLFKTEFLSCFNLVIGSHPTELPRGRGRAPVPWTILTRQTQSAVSFFLMDEGVDTGEVILQKKFNIPQNVNATLLYDLVATNLSEGFVEILTLLKSGNELMTVELKQEVSHTAKRTKWDGRIDFTQNSVDVDLLVRAITHPYPGAYTYYKDQRVFFFSTRLVSVDDYSGVPGQILEMKDDSIRVKCGSGSVWLSDPAFENGTPIDISFFKLHDTFGLRIEDEFFKIKQELKTKGIIE